MKKDKLIINCPNCGKRMRIPANKKKIIINCPTCSVSFPYKKSFFNFSYDVKRLMLAGSIGAVLGFLITEIVRISASNQLTNEYQSAAVTFGILGMCIGGFLGSTEGFIKKNKYRLKYGIQIGLMLGGVGGVIAGVIAQFCYIYMLNTGLVNSIFTLILVRSFNWALFGLLLGLSYGIKENTLGDLKSGALSGVIGGGIGGILFDPITLIVSAGEGTVARGIGFIIIGATLGTAIKFLQEKAVSNDKSDMYKPLSKSLPTNYRLLE